MKTKEEKKLEKHKKWINSGPAIIEKPLKFVATNGGQFKQAFSAADRGKGHIVTKVAYETLNRE